MTEYGNDYVIHHPLIKRSGDESVELTGTFVRDEIKRLKSEINRLSNELNQYENRLIFGSRGSDGDYGKGVAEVNEYGRVQFTELAAGISLSTQQAVNFAAWIQAANK